MEIDALDAKILRFLQRDGRASFIEIAEKLNLNESTIRKRVIRLKEKKVIKNFTVNLDPARMGFTSIAVVGIDAEPVKLIEIAEKLAEIPETVHVATSTGDHMIMTEVWAKDGKELTKVISEKIGSIEGVKKICPSIILEKMKG
jgi:Lrp/AsnC family transcriptional regulator for asnA, asnC and gidA